MELQSTATNKEKTYLRPSSSHLGVPFLVEAAVEAEGAFSLGAEPAGTAPLLSTRFFVFMSSVTFFNPAKTYPLVHELPSILEDMQVPTSQMFQRTFPDILQENNLNLSIQADQ